MIFPDNHCKTILSLCPGKKNRLIPFIISESLRNKLSHAQVENSKKFLFIDDFIRAIFKILAQKILMVIINLGSHENFKIKRIILMITNYLKLGKPLFGKIKLRKDESMIYYPNINKAKKLINWRSQIKFEKGLTKTIKYYLKKK